MSISRPKLQTSSLMTSYHTTAILFCFYLLIVINIENVPWILFTPTHLVVCCDNQVIKDLLLAISSCKERFEVFMNKERLQDGLDMQPGGDVVVRLPAMSGEVFGKTKSYETFFCVLLCCMSSVCCLKFFLRLGADAFSYNTIKLKKFAAVTGQYYCIQDCSMILCM